MQQTIFRVRCKTQHSQLTRFYCSYVANNNVNSETNNLIGSTITKPKPKPKRVSKIVSMNAIPLVSGSDMVHFPLSEVNFRVTEPKYNVMLDEMKGPILGVISEYSSPEADKEYIKKHELLLENKDVSDLFFFQGISNNRTVDTTKEDSVIEKNYQITTNLFKGHSTSSSSSSSQSQSSSSSSFDLSGSDKKETTEWNCADIGTLIRVSKFPIISSQTVSRHSLFDVNQKSSSDFSQSTTTSSKSLEETKPIKSKSIKSKSKKTSSTSTTITSPTTQRYIDGIALQRFRVRSYRRSLFGFWEADIELLKEEWGVGGQKKAIEMMNHLRSLIEPQLIHIVEKDLQNKLLNETNPSNFSYLLPQILSLFGISSLTTQAILQCKTCVERLGMEISIVQVLNRVFSNRMKKQIEYHPGGKGNSSETSNSPSQKEKSKEN